MANARVETSIVKKAKRSSFLPLRDEGRWVNDSKGKAALFAKSFDAKAKLPDEDADCYLFGYPVAEYDDFITLRSRHTLELLQDLDEARATGSAKIPCFYFEAHCNIHRCPIHNGLQTTFDPGVVAELLEALFNMPADKKNPHSCLAITGASI